MDFLNRVYVLDVSCFSDEEVFKYWYGKMDESRKKKIDKYKYDKDKALSLGAGVLFREVLERAGLKDFSLEYRERQKPYLKGKSDVFFNLSHSGERAALALSDREVGVDIERTKEFTDSLLDFVFDEDEKGYTDKTAPEADTFYTRLWTCKESVMKFYGKGLSLDPKKIHLREDEAVKNLMRARCPEPGSERFFLHSFETDAYQLTVCTEYMDFKGPVLAKIKGKELVLT